MRRPRPAEVEHRKEREPGRGCRALVRRRWHRWHRERSVRATWTPAPTPPWCPAASPEPSCSGGRRLGALGDGRGRGAVRWGAGGALGVRRGRAGAVSDGSCIVGRAPREDGRGSGCSAHSPASGVGGSLRMARRRSGSAESAGTSGVRHPPREAPPLFRIRHPQSRPAPTPRSPLRGSVEGTGWLC